MGFPGVVPEHVPGTLGEHGMFPVPCSLFPLPLNLPPPQFFFLRRQFSLRRPWGRLVTCSLFPVPCSHKTPLREHVFRVPCSLCPYGKTHPCDFSILGREAIKRGNPPARGDKMLLICRSLSLLSRGKHRKISL